VCKIAGLNAAEEDELDDEEMGKLNLDSKIVNFEKILV
jgi:hypothetical protein